MIRIYSLFIYFVLLISAIMIFACSTFAKDDWDRAEVRGGEIVDGKIVFCYELSGGNMNLRFENYSHKSYRSLEFRISGEYRRNVSNKWHSLAENTRVFDVRPIKDGEPQGGTLFNIITTGSDDIVELRSVTVVILRAEEKK